MGLILTVLFVCLFGYLGPAFAEGKPFMGISLSPDSVSFRADSSPGIYDSQPVDVMVRSENKDWTIQCEAISPLSHSNGKNQIPSKRLYLNSPFTKADVDNGAGPGFESMEKPRLAAKGSFTAPMSLKVSSLRFRLLTTWEDKPGTYAGHIRFTYITTP